MERVIKWPIRSLDSNRAFENSVLVRSCVKTQGYTLKLHCVGNQKLDEIATRLPELFLHNECKIIKSEKKIRVVRLPLSIGHAIKSVYVKQHNALSCWHRLASLFCASPALRSLSGAAVLLQEGYATARPIAAVEHRRRGVLIRSFYLAEEIAGAKTIADYWREDLLSPKGIDGHLKRRAVLKTLACLFKSLHEKRIYHNDLKASNILALDRGLATKEMYSLIDLQGVRKCFYLSKRRRIKNLAQINRTLGNYLTRTQKLLFLKGYLGDEISDRRYTRHLVRRILDETGRQITKTSGRPKSLRMRSLAMIKRHAADWPFASAVWFFFGLSGLGFAHSGIVDGYGCHRGADKVSYHCHQGQFIGRTFKSKEDFLRQLRGGKSEQLSPKNNPPRLEKKIDE